MIAIPVEMEQDVLSSEVIDLRRKVDPKSKLFRALIEHMERRSCTALWLTKPKSRPKYYETRSPETPFFEKIPRQYSDEMKALLSNFGGEVLVLEPNDHRAEFIGLKDSLDTVCASFFVQSVTHINRKSRVLYTMLGLPEQGIGKFTNSELTLCCVDHLIFSLQKRGVETDLRMFIGGHYNHKPISSQDTLFKWFSLLKG